MGKFIDLTGQRFGKWTVLKRVKNDKNGSSKFLCKCDCGALKEILSFTLRNGTSTNCGCYLGERTNKEIGKKYNHWTVLEKAESNKYGQPKWLCQCDCGKLRKLYLPHIKSGKSKSCGCCRKEVLKKQNVKHGMSNTKIYNIWSSMKRRCYTKTQTAYKHYGARGIKICDKWLDKDNGFMNFYNWAIKNGYHEGLSIDRINVDGNYEPKNCRWVTQKVQSNNTRRNVYIVYNEEKHTLKEWSDLLNLNYKAVFNRYQKGFSLQEVFYRGDLREKGGKNEKSNK